ncbi:MAG TPA: hypothetical protein V6D50_21610 [Chroococcales cyanobacterium]|jgi:hypothetical protein
MERVDLAALSETLPGKKLRARTTTKVKSMANCTAKNNSRRVPDPMLLDVVYWGSTEKLLLVQ